MEIQEKRNPHKGGRHPKKDPAIHRYSISLNEVENARFLTLFETSGMHVMAHFIKVCVFQKVIKTVKIDKAAMDYYMRLTTLYGQFRAVGVNYNQLVKIFYRNFSEKQASAHLYKLEKQTIELSVLSKKIIELTQEFEINYLKK
ncbi:conjugal transfer protein MobA [Flavobacterium fluviatile]|uniref:conjugal transfer protein MobA n=1 Tax=Flavobacterium fluviatile TaxID=1862387 RepID=UPI0013D18E7C|nr:conjugal transfer protein MobA [Flavobacterium fluviatile]